MIFRKLTSSISNFVARNISPRVDFRQFVISFIHESRKMSDDREKMQRELSEIFDSAVASVMPEAIVENRVSVTGAELCIGEKKFPIDDNVYLVGFGKAVMGMAAKMEQKLGSRLRRGIVSIPRGSRDSENLKTLPNFVGPVDYREGATDNQPDEDSLLTSHEIADLAESLEEKDTLLVLISGGGSALFYMPRAILAPEAKIEFCRKLQNAGAEIRELNTVRQKLSMVKGGGLAAMAHPAKVITLILSDIVGDPVELVASGPTIYSEKSPEVVLAILKKYNLLESVDGDMRNILTSREVKIDGNLLDSSKRFKHVENFVIGNNSLAIEAACREAKKKGFSPIILRNDVIGNVRECSRSYAKIAHLVCQAWSKIIERKEFLEAINDDTILRISGSKINEIFSTLEDFNDGPILLIGGGEPEVVVRGNGKGGRNQELALGFSIDILERAKKNLQLVDYEIMFLSAATDGQDGPTDATGAYGYPAVLPIIEKLMKRFKKISNDRIIDGKISENSEFSKILRIADELAPQNVLDDNDSYNFYSRFRRGKDLFKTGITGTNVMDLHFLLIKKRHCGCNLNFERGEKCPDPMEEHDFSENIAGEIGIIKRDVKNDVGESKLLNLRIFDSSLGEKCCEKKD